MLQSKSILDGKHMTLRCWGVFFRKRSRMKIPTMVCGGNAGDLHLTRRIFWFIPLPPPSPPRACSKDPLDGLDPEMADPGNTTQMFLGLQSTRTRKDMVRGEVEIFSDPDPDAGSNTGANKLTAAGKPFPP